MPKLNVVNPSSLLTIEDIMAWYKANPWPLGNIDTYFPLDLSLSDTWKTIYNEDFTRNEAADPIHSGSPVPVAGRDGFVTVMGDMAEMGKGKEMVDDELTKFDELKKNFATVKNAQAATQLVNFYGGDLEFIRRAIEAQRIYLCWFLLSNACSISFSATNSPYFQSITSNDYPVEAWQKNEVGTSWADPAALILNDIKAVVTAAEAEGRYYAEIKINDVWFEYVRQNTQIKTQTITLIASLTGAATNPTLDEINRMLANYFQFSIRFVVVNEKITRGLVDGTKTTANPFQNGVAVFTVGAQVGRFVYKPLLILDSTKEAIENYYVVGTKTGTDPNYLKNYSKAKGFPVVDSWNDNYYLKIDAVPWA